MDNLALLRKIHAGANDYYREDDAVVSHIAILRSWLDHESPEDIAYVFDYDDNRFYDRLYTIDPFLHKCAWIIENAIEDAYFSINSFWKKKKQTEDIRHLNAFALDFDFYKKRKYRNFTPIEMYQKYIKPALPMKPTAVIDSGRGLYIVYAFHHCSIMRLNLYRSIYKQFQQRFEEFGMDPQATNVTQVIRIPGSYNPKADKVVEIIEYNDTEYELTDFCRLLPYTYEQAKIHRKEQIAKNLKQKEIELKESTKTNRKKECKAFLEDLKQLIVMRNRQKYYIGYRECLMYLALEKLLWAGYDKDTAIREANKLNDQFHDPMLPREVEKQCMPTRIHFNCNSTRKVLSKLAITDEEQKKLQVIVNKEFKDLRKKNRKKRHPLLNRTKKEVDLLIRRTAVIKMKKSGKKNVEIARSLDVDKSTITQDLKYVNAHKNEFRKVLGESIEALESALNDVTLVRRVMYDELKRLRKWAENSAYVLDDS